jgi:endonuclease/exonuclease/phosphatase (EEP) superfamily protein YafD
MRTANGTMAFVTAVVLALTLGLGFATLCAVLGGLAWTLELFSHFRIQWAALALLTLLVSLALRHGPLIVVNAVLLTVNVAALVPHLMSYVRPPATAEATGRAVRIFSLNMHGSDTDPQKFLALLSSESPDIVVLTEIPGDIEQRTAALRETYPHRIAARSQALHDIMLLSRWPIAAVETNRSAGPNFPIVAADLCPSSGERGACLRVVTLHADAPFGTRAATQSRQLDVAARLAGSHLGASAVVGDLNAAPWSPAFARLKERANLADASRWRGLTATWQPMGLGGSIAALIALPIDHVLASQDIAVRASRVGPDIGSDHRPIIVDLQLPDLAHPAMAPRL